MIYRPSALATTERLREIPQDSQQDFPHIAIESDLERYAGRCSSWHWHDYFEFAVVCEGEMELGTQRSSMRIAAGDGYFINSNVLHLCRVADGSAKTRLHVHQFHRSLIAGCAAVSRRYVQPLEGCAALEAIQLRRENPDHAIILREMEAAFADASAESPGWELSISQRLISSWQALYRQAAPVLNASGSVTTADSGRIKQMLAYIHSHFSESITVAMIARSANIGDRECFRCFQQVLGTTPTLYLMRHRVNAAARMLIESGSSITEIALACGFSGPSYFSKVFHSIIGQSPRDFRKMGQR